MTTVGVAIPTIPPRGRLLERALKSVRAQTRAVDDISVAYDMRKQGAAPTRNRAARDLDTEWVAFLDDDDELYPRHIELLLATAEATQADLVYPWFDIVGGRDPLAAPNEQGHPVNPFGREFTPRMRAYLISKANFIPVTYLVRRRLFDEVGGFPTPGASWWQHKDCEDWAFLIKVAESGAKIVHLPERTWVWHHHNKNTSGRGDRW